MKRDPPVVVGSRKVRVQVAKYFRSHPFFRVPTGLPKKLAVLLKRLR
ncbi:hypothetical protein [Mesorhizobium sp. WSM3862]|nr:hypothetical protein [Mesorhizobium sp. WSM3862]